MKSFFSFATFVRFERYISSTPYKGVLLVPPPNAATTPPPSPPLETTRVLFSFPRIRRESCLRGRANDSAGKFHPRGAEKCSGNGWKLNNSADEPISLSPLADRPLEHRLWDSTLIASRQPRFLWNVNPTRDCRAESSFVFCVVSDFFRTPRPDKRPAQRVSKIDNRSVFSWSLDSLDGSKK